MAIHCFEQLTEHHMSDGKECTREVLECIGLIYEREKGYIESNDPSHFSLNGLDRLEERYLIVAIDVEQYPLYNKLEKKFEWGNGHHPLYDQLVEKARLAFLQCVEKRDYKNALSWLYKIEHETDIDTDEMIQAIFNAGASLMDEKEYEKALSWLRKLPRNYKPGMEKLEECHALWDKDSRNPDYCVKSPDGKHHWETKTHMKTIDCNIRQAGHGVERCTYCGKSRSFSYDYDTDGY